MKHIHYILCLILLLGCSQPEQSYDSYVEKIKQIDISFEFDCRAFETSSIPEMPDSVQNLFKPESFEKKPKQEIESSPQIKRKSFPKINCDPYPNNPCPCGFS